MVEVGPMYITQEVDIADALRAGNLQEICGAQKGEVPKFLQYSSENCPTGFEWMLDTRTVVLQRVDPCWGLFCRFSFDILNTNGEKIFEANPGGLCDCGFVMRINKGGQELAYSQRSYLATCMPIGCICCDEGLRVEAPKGNVLGFVTIRLDCKCGECGECCKCDGKCGDCCKGCKCDCKCNCTCCCGVVSKPIFFIMDPLRQLMMTINVELLALCPEICNDKCLLPRYCGSNCRDRCLDKIYILRAHNTDIVGAGTIIGELRRICDGCTMECTCCKSPRYSVTFPEDLEIRMKIVVMHAIFLMNNLGH